MNRLPALSEQQWSDEQRQLAEEIINGPRGALLPPFEPLLRSPELMAHAQRMGEYLRYRSAGAAVVGTGHPADRASLVAAG
jgi:4-carboxymuconolactone decarboxylase